MENQVVPKNKVISIKAGPVYLLPYKSQKNGQSRRNNINRKQFHFTLLLRGDSDSATVSVYLRAIFIEAQKLSRNQ